MFPRVKLSTFETFCKDFPMLLQVDLKNIIGTHECSEFPQSLFDDSGCIRQGDKSPLKYFIASP